MTRKDFVAIAAALADSRPDNSLSTINGLTISTTPVGEQWLYERKKIADALAKDNPRFDRERFYSACEKVSV